MWPSHHSTNSNAFGVMSWGACQLLAGLTNPKTIRFAKCRELWVSFIRLPRTRLIRHQPIFKSFVIPAFRIAHSSRGEGRRSNTGSWKISSCWYNAGIFCFSQNNLASSSIGHFCGQEMDKSEFNNAFSSFLRHSRTQDHSSS